MCVIKKTKNVSSTKNIDYLIHQGWYNMLPWVEDLYVTKKRNVAEKKKKECRSIWVQHSKDIDTSSTSDMAIWVKAVIPWQI